MIFILRPNVSGSEVIELIKDRSASYRVLDLYGRRVIVAWPDKLVEDITSNDIELKVKTKHKFQLASIEWRDRTVVEVDGVSIGGKNVVVAAGPCAIEDEDTFIEIARAVKKAGAKMVRGGVFKPRTSPYAFQGLGIKGVEIIKKAKDAVGLPIVSEVMDTRDVELMSRYVDMLQIGARNAQNFALLKEVGRKRKPVLLKRGFGMTVEEWLLTAEYILLEGNGDVVLCERGIRTFESSTRFTLDIAGMVAAKSMTHLPIAVDPSHPAGRRNYVEPLALAAVAAGADMIIVEVHVDPVKALSDSEQQLTIKEFEELMKKLKLIANALGRDV